MNTHSSKPGDFGTSKDNILCTAVLLASVLSVLLGAFSVDADTATEISAKPTVVADNHSA